MNAGNFLKEIQLILHHKMPLIFILSFLDKAVCCCFFINKMLIYIYRSVYSIQCCSDQHCGLVGFFRVLLFPPTVKDMQIIPIGVPKMAILCLCLCVCVIGNLSRVYPASYPQSPGIGFRLLRQDKVVQKIKVCVCGPSTCCPAHRVMDEDDKDKFCYSVGS